VIFNNSKFNNEYLDIDTDYQNTLLGHKEDKEQEKRDRIRQALEHKERVAREVKNSVNQEK